MAGGVDKVKIGYRSKLFLIMITFAVIISVVLAVIDYSRLRSQASENNQVQVQLIEEMVLSSLQNMEKSIMLFDQDTAAKMETNTQYLLDLYRREADVHSWDFQSLKDVLGMDVYLIDERNVITHSSFTDDIGLDFSKCCGKLVPKLDEIRESGEIWIDGLDIEQATGNVKKYSYAATPDKKYVIQLGYSVQNHQIFKEFNFLRVIEQLVERYALINQIHVLNIGGYAFGEPVAEMSLTPERRQAFEHTLASGETNEIEGLWNNEEPAIYRYVHFVSEYDTGTTKNKVLEIVYNQRDLQSLLSRYTIVFFIQLSIVLVIAIIVSFLLSKWLSKPMYLAFHDSLTGLKNRAAFEETLKTRLREDDRQTVLMLIDLDNFKCINDQLGHDEGDQILKLAASAIRDAIRQEDYAFRIGGDEFAVVMSTVEMEEIETVASRILETINESMANHCPSMERKITVSIGVALAPELGGDGQQLFKRADQALYASKQKGKNQFHIDKGSY